MSANTTKSIRFPPPLRRQVEAKAAAERRSFSRVVLNLVEDGLGQQSAALDVDQDEVERLADLAVSAIHGPVM